MRPNWSLIFGELIREKVEREEEEEEEEEEKEEEEGEESQRKVWSLLSFVWNLYGNYDFGMVYWTFRFCMELFDEEETINPFFFL